MCYLDTSISPTLKNISFIRKVSFGATFVFSDWATFIDVRASRLMYLWLIKTEVKQQERLGTLGYFERIKIQSSPAPAPARRTGI